jgi:hypothetical protein
MRRQTYNIQVGFSFNSLFGDQDVLRSVFRRSQPLFTRPMRLCKPRRRPKELRKFVSTGIPFGSPAVGTQMVDRLFNTLFQTDNATEITQMVKVPQPN